eukprot:TRINITY_DN5806_c0_g1_i1.p1 TRINITY_DN5806_c0_g1~~TRINITY_DN5806_c0_g1_i1.p1  ORF type:complete len:471 (-),score=55.06 TRINITY_DN5806_c0_g1_i1:53-1465(-)
MHVAPPFIFSLLLLCNYASAATYVDKGRRKFGDCVTQCKSEGWILPTVETAAEHDELFSSLSGPPDGVWLGLLNPTGTGVTRMKDSSSTYLNWKNDEPNDIDQGYEACVGSDKDGWYDVPCANWESQCICKNETATATEDFDTLYSAVTSADGGVSVGTDYFRFYQWKDLPSCSAACQGKEWVLPTVKDAAANTKLNNAFPNTQIWLGIINPEEKTIHRMTSGDNTYTNWKEGEPNNNDNWNEPCVMMNFGGIQDYTGQWYDAPCTDFRSACVCEKSTATVASNWATLVEDGKERVRIFSGKDVGGDYYRFDEHLTGPGCSEACIDKGWVLPIVESKEENNELKDLAPREQIWLGMANPHGKDIVRMTDSSSTYKNWFGGEPNNHEGANEVCMQMNFPLFEIDFSGKWFDVNCWDWRSVCICKKSSAKPVSSWAQMLKDGTETRRAGAIPQVNNWLVWVAAVAFGLFLAP